MGGKQLTGVVLAISHRVNTKGLLTIDIDVDFVVAKEARLSLRCSKRVETHEDAGSDSDGQDEQPSAQDGAATHDEVVVERCFEKEKVVAEVEGGLDSTLLLFGANLSEQKSRYAGELKMMMPGRTAKTCRERHLKGCRAWRRK